MVIGVLDKTEVSSHLTSHTPIMSGWELDFQSYMLYISYIHIDIYIKKWLSRNN